MEETLDQNESDYWTEYVSDEEMEARRSEVADQYRFYVTKQTNENEEVVAEGYSLFFQTEDGEFPLLQNTGGQDIINSATVHTGEQEHIDALPASEDFVDAVGCYYHQMASFMGPGEDLLEQSIESVYSVDDIGNAPRHEAWATAVVAPQFFFGKTVPEMEPLAEYAYNWTEFGMPEPMEKTYTPPSER